MAPDRVRLGVSPACLKEGHEIDLVFRPDLGLGTCKRCPGVFIDLRKWSEREDEKERAQYGVAGGDIIEARGEILRVLVVRDPEGKEIVCKRMDENGDDIPGDAGEVVIGRDEYRFVMTRAEWFKAREEREAAILKEKKERFFAGEVITLLPREWHFVHVNPDFPTEVFIESIDDGCLYYAKVNVPYTDREKFLEAVFSAGTKWTLVVDPNEQKEG